MRKVLLSSQKSWMQVRDRTCDFETLVLWGLPKEGQRGRSVACLARKTYERAKELNDWYGCLAEGGSDACAF